MENCNNCIHKDVCVHCAKLYAFTKKIQKIFEEESDFDIFQTKIYCKFYSNCTTPIISKNDIGKLKPPNIRLDNVIPTSKKDAMIDRILNKIRHGEALDIEEREFGLQMINGDEHKSPTITPDMLPPASRPSNKDTSETNKKRFGPSYIIGDMSPSDVRKIN